jgi:hypothetical protein
MFYRATPGLVLSILFLSMARADETPARFHWQPGQVLTYRVAEQTSSLAVVEDSKVETKTSLYLTKRWQVLGVDANGVGTLQLSVTAMAFEMPAPDGGVLRYDSATPDKSTPALREQMSRYVGKPIAELRIDARGQVVEVKKSHFGPASDYAIELPFLVTLPATGPRQGQTWQREYVITLPPPKGTGEKYDAVQTYTCTKAADGRVTVRLATALKSPPEVGEQIHLFQFLPEGEAVLDARDGKLLRGRLRVDRKIEDYPAPGSTYTFHREYTIEPVAGH